MNYLNNMPLGDNEKRDVIKYLEVKSHEILYGHAEY